MQKRPLWVGFSLAPLGAPLAYLAWALFFFTDTTPKHEATETFIPALLVFTLASYIASLVAGVPLVLILKRFKKLSFGWITVPAVLLGGAMFTTVFFLLLATGATIKGSVWREIALFFGVGGAYGFTVAAAFCVLVGITLPSISGGKRARSREPSR